MSEMLTRCEFIFNTPACDYFYYLRALFERSVNENHLKENLEDEMESNK
jgi:hypothetical protein